MADAQAGRTRELAGLALFLGVFALLLVATALVLGWPLDWELRNFWNYAVPCGLAVWLVGGARRRMPPTIQVGVALLAALLVLGGILVGRGSTLLFDVFLYFLPVFGAVAVLGTARYRLTATQMVGATLLFIAAWRPLYESFPDLTALPSAGGVLEPLSVRSMYNTVVLKLEREELYVLAGLPLAFGVALSMKPWRAWADGLGRVTQRIGAHPRHAAWIDLGLGATVYLIALLGTFALSWLFAQSEALSGGADESRLFANITPDLVLLISLAAGVGEELIFRAVLQPYFERGWRAVFPGRIWPAAALAILCQSVLFGVVHAGYSNLAHVLIPFAFGVLTGVAYRLWGLLPVVYAHVTIDIFAFGYQASGFGYPWMDGVLAVLLVANLLVGLAVPVYLGLRRYDRWRQRALARSAE